MAKPIQSSAVLPTNFIWDIQQVSTAPIDPAIKELLVRLYQNLNLMANVLTIADKGAYQQQEFITGQSLFPNPNYNSSTAQKAVNRTVLRKVINFGALPNAATKSVPHGITCTGITTFLKIYAVASDTSAETYIPIPYASATNVAHNIELYVDGTNVNITTGTNYSAYNFCYVVLEYIQM